MREFFGGKKRFLLQAIFGIFFLYLVFQIIDFERLTRIIWKIEIHFLLLAMFVYFCLDLLLSYRLWKCLSTIGHKISWRETFWVHLFGMLLSNVTPGRAGYVGLTYLLKKKKKVPIHHGLSTIGTIEAIELIVKASTACLGLSLIVYFTRTQVLVLLGLIGIAVILAMSCIFLFLCWKEVESLNRLVEKVPFFGKRVMVLIKGFKSTSVALKSKSSFIASFSILGWLIRGIEWTFIGLACGINLPFIIFLLLHPILTAIRYLPLTPAGIGMFEGITLLGFSVFGIPLENALLLSFFDRIDNVVVDLIAIKEFKYL